MAQITAHLAALAAPKHETVTVTVGGTRKQTAGWGAPQVMRMLLLQILTGRRLSEICLTEFDCLSPGTGLAAEVAEHERIARFRYGQSKIDQAPDTILVDAEVVAVIAEQQQWVREQFPGLASQMTPSVATESQMQLANVFGGRWDERKKWGFHIMDSWKLFFDTGRAIGQITGDFKLEDVVKNDLVDEANAFDAAKVKADADGFPLSDDYKKVDVEAIKKAL